LGDYLELCIVQKIYYVMPNVRAEWDIIDKSKFMFRNFTEFAYSLGCVIKT